MKIKSNDFGLLIFLTVVLQEQIEIYRRVFVESSNQVQKLDEALAQRLERQPQAYNPPVTTVEIPTAVTKCPKCNANMILRKHGPKFYIGCTGFPVCKTSIWFPAYVLSLTATNESCTTCQRRDIKRLKFEFRRLSMPHSYPLQYEGCIGGCDPDFLEDLEIHRNIFT